MHYALRSMLSAKEERMNQELRPILFTQGIRLSRPFLWKRSSIVPIRLLSGTGKCYSSMGTIPAYPLLEWLAQRYGVKVEQVLLGNGSMEFFTFVASVMVNRGDAVYIEYRAMTGPLQP